MGVVTARHEENKRRQTEDLVEVDEDHEAFSDAGDQIRFLPPVRRPGQVEWVEVQDAPLLPRRFLLPPIAARFICQGWHIAAKRYGATLSLVWRRYAQLQTRGATDRHRREPFPARRCKKS